MVGRRIRSITSGIGSRLLLCVLSVQAAFVLALVVGLHFWATEAPEIPAVVVLLGATAVGLVMAAAWTAGRGIRNHVGEKARHRAVSNLMETVLETSQEWVWALAGYGNFTFSSMASATLLGYDPDELIGRPVTMIMDPDELASARKAVAAVAGKGSDWTGVSIAYRHRSGAPEWMEVFGRARPSQDGQRPGYEVTSRPLAAQTVRTILKNRIRKRFDSTVQGGLILTDFQPTYELATGTMLGVEALARFPSDDGRSPLSSG